MMAMLKIKEKNKISLLRYFRYLRNAQKFKCIFLSMKIIKFQAALGVKFRNYRQSTPL